jgi:hypothetical protein
MILTWFGDIRGRALLVIVFTLGTTAVASAALITPGDFVVYRVGDGTAPSVGTNAAAVDILEYSPAGALVQTISMPSSGAAAFTDTFNSTSDGILQVSSDGAYITYAGYRRDAGLSSPDAQSATTTNRVFARLNVATGVVDASTAATVPNQVRGVATDGTNNYWISDSSGSPRYLAYGGTGNGAVLTNSISGSVATRQVSVVGGKLYASITSATPGSGIYSFNPSLPTTGTGTTVTSMVTGGSFQGFLLADLDAGVAGVDTLYAVEIGGNTLNKYSLVGGTWTLNNTLAAGGMQNLGGYVIGTDVVLYGSQFGKVATLTDSSGYNASNNGTVTDVAGVTAAANYNFKGIAVVPAVPEPSSFVLLAMAGLAFFPRRR